MDHSKMDHSKMNHDMMPGMNHDMAGIPLWMAIAGMACIIVISHLLLWRKDKYDTEKKSYFRFSLFRIPFFKKLVLQSWYPIFLQFIPVLLLFIIITSGLFGSPRKNIATVLTWGWWWVLLIFIILIAGKSFCSMCPWEAISSIVSSLSLQSRKKKIGYELKWPSYLKNLYPAILLFVALTWLELGFEVTRSPELTAILAIIMTSMAVLSAIIFEKRAFCRYSCLVGRISGLYAMFSPVELRSVSATVCKTCKGKECMNGSSNTASCPTNLYPGGLIENTYCTLCTECIRSCPNDNLTINFRSPATDLFSKSSFRLDESILALVLLSLTSFHGLTMTPLWTIMVNQTRLIAGVSYLISFTILMALVIAIPFVLYLLTIFISSVFIRIENVSIPLLFKAFAYPLIPVALFYHLAHNGMHFFAEATTIIPLLSDPAGLGWNLFNTIDYIPGQVVSQAVIWWIQLGFIFTGHVYGVITADKISMRLFQNKNQGLKALVPQIVFMVIFSGISIWLIAQPMEMRTGM